MWECSYGKEPLDIRLLVLRFLRKSPLVVLAALVGAICIGGPYFLKKVTFGPAKEYEAVTDFYIDYALQESGEEYTYFNQTTWTQLITDDVFTDKVLVYMSWDGMSVDEETIQAAPLPDIEKAAGLTKQQLREYLYATMLSDTRIVTTTVTTNDPELTMRIEKALIRAMEDFGNEQKEIEEVRILQEPAEASLVVADVRTFRACMLGAVIFAFVTGLYLLLYFVLDEGIHVPVAFERRFGVPMLGTICSGELPALAKKLFLEDEKFFKPVLVTADETVELEQVKTVLEDREVETERNEELEKSLRGLYQKTYEEMECNESGVEELQSKKLMLVVKAGAHNGKRIEKLLGFCRMCDLNVVAALLWEADERLIKVYEAPEHVLHAWRCRRSVGKKA